VSLPIGKLVVLLSALLLMLPSVVAAVLSAAKTPVGSEGTVNTPVGWAGLAKTPVDDEEAGDIVDKNKEPEEGELGWLEKTPVGWSDAAPQAEFKFEGGTYSSLSACRFAGVDPTKVSL